MGLFQKKGLSEPQRLQVSLVEKKMCESKEWLEANLKEFRIAYRDLVMKFGIKHVPQMTIGRLRGLILSIAEQECKEEIDVFKKNQEEAVKKVEKDNGNGVIKN